MDEKIKRIIAGIVALAMFALALWLLIAKTLKSEPGLWFSVYLISSVFLGAIGYYSAHYAYNGNFI